MNGLVLVVFGVALFCLAFAYISARNDAFLKNARFSKLDRRFENIGKKMGAFRKDMDLGFYNSDKAVVDAANRAMSVLGGAMVREREIIQGSLGKNADALRALRQLSITNDRAVRDITNKLDTAGRVQFLDYINKLEKRHVYVVRYLASGGTLETLVKALTPLAEKPAAEGFVVEGFATDEMRSMLARAGVHLNDEQTAKLEEDLMSDVEGGMTLQDAMYKRLFQLEAAVNQAKVFDEQDRQAITDLRDANMDTRFAEIQDLYLDNDKAYKQALGLQHGTITTSGGDLQQGLTAIAESAKAQVEAVSAATRKATDTLAGMISAEGVAMAARAAARQAAYEAAVQEDAARVAADKAAYESAQRAAAQRAEREAAEAAMREIDERAARDSAILTANVKAARLAAEEATKAEEIQFAQEAFALALRRQAAREALAKAEAEQAAKDAAELARKQELARQAAEKAAREAAAQAEAERIAREAAVKAAAEKAAREAAEKAEAERQARVYAERLAAEKAAREQAAREEAARVAREQAAREAAARAAAEQAAREEAARQAARRAAEEQARRDAERAAAERAQREAEARAQQQREAAARAAAEQAQREAAARAAEEQRRREEAERAARQEAERQAAERAAAEQRRINAEREAAQRAVREAEQRAAAAREAAAAEAMRNLQAQSQAAMQGTWSNVAREHGNFQADGLVRYGMGSSWVTKEVRGQGQCTNSWFGRDPIVGTVKQCDVQQKGWTTISREGGSFNVRGMVRYGSGSNWLTKDVQGDGQCTNHWFGRDPLPGTVKQCDHLR